MMDDFQIARDIRMSLKSAFPDTVFQVTVVDGHLDISTIGGCKNYAHLTDEQVRRLFLDAVWKILPTYELWFEEE